MLEVQLNNGDIYLTTAIAFALDKIIFDHYDVINDVQEQLFISYQDVLRVIVGGQKMTNNL